MQSLENKLKGLHVPLDELGPEPRESFNAEHKKLSTLLTKLIGKAALSKKELERYINRAFRFCPAWSLLLLSRSRILRTGRGRFVWTQYRQGPTERGAVDDRSTALTFTRTHRLHLLHGLPFTGRGHPRIEADSGHAAAACRRIVQSCPISDCPSAD